MLIERRHLENTTVLQLQGEIFLAEQFQVNVRVQSVKISDHFKGFFITKPDPSLVWHRISKQL